MKGILKIYHPEETLKYHIKSTYCKAVYSNENHFLEVEILTDDSLDHVDDDSLQYHFPQICLKVIEFPIDGANLLAKNFKITEETDEIFTEVDLFDDEEAYLYDNELAFDQNSENDLQLFWKGSIDDFYSGSEQSIAFQLKCNFKPDPIVIDED